MKGILLAGAIAATVAIVIPAHAQTPEPNPNPNPNPPTAAASEPIGAPEERGGGEPGAAAAPAMPGGGWAMHGSAMMHGGAPMHEGAMMHGDMWRRAWMRRDPQQHCIDRLAWRAARRAYVETELNLTPEQRPLWDKVQSIAQSEQQHERQLCAQLKPPSEMTVLGRMDQAQQFLSARLDALQAAKPAVQALYQSLSPEQREIFDHPFHRG